MWVTNYNMLATQLTLMPGHFRPFPPYP
jgi:hypothetical protein